MRRKIKQARSSQRPIDTYGDTRACQNVFTLLWKMRRLEKFVMSTEKSPVWQNVTRKSSKYYLSKQTGLCMQLQMFKCQIAGIVTTFQGRNHSKLADFYFKVLSYADHSCTPQNHRCVQFVHRVGELIHKANFDYGHKCAEWWIKKPRLKRWNSSLFFCLCWPANSGKMSETNQIWFVKVSPLKASVWRWIRRGEIFVLTNKYLIAVLFQGISCGGVKDTSVQIF